MKMRVLRSIFLAFAILSAVCCREKGKAEATLATRAFPEVKVPSVLTTQEEISEYVISHFWDRFLHASGEYLCDSTHVAGVSDRELAGELASFLSILENDFTVGKAQLSIAAFFDSLSSYQRADTASNVFEKITEAVTFYLYDPNSDIRSEDLYLPFVKGLATSDLVKEEMKAAYQYDVRMCSLNRYGTPAADFVYVDKVGRRHKMTDIKADYTVMVFVNPGCKACGEAVEAFTTPYVEQLIQDGKVAVMDIYIDEDITKWHEQSSGLPETWISGYDPEFIIRKDQIYNVRAIPSIYLLDSDKKVILKDAPAEKVINYLTALN